MLPFALKVVWFVLSFTGVIACCVVLSIFARVTGVRWGSALYCVLATVLEGAFCLGMIWEMDPYKMPRGFCIAQALVTYYATYSLTGFCAGFTLATTGWVLWPSTMINLGRHVLGYDHKQLVFLLGFPLACAAVAIPVLIKLDAIQPVDGMSCDASHPVWSRFLGYAGLPLIFAIPCFIISSAAVLRVRKIHLRSRSFNVFESNGQTIDLNFAALSLLQTQLQVTASQPASDTVSKPTPFIGEAEKRNTSNLVDAPPGAVGGEEGPGSSSHSRTFTSSLPSVPTLGSIGLVNEQNDEETPRIQRPSAIASDASPSIGHVGPSLGPAIWRLLLFQMSFFSVVILAALSTIIDVALHRTSPSPFGTQHIALILVGWGPLIVFGPLPSVRKHLLFWRQPRS